MSDKPILFSAPMVRALLDGRKTQTRRIIKPQPPEGIVRHCWYDAPLYGFTRDHDVSSDWHVARLLAYKGDRLWVRETWAPLSALTHNDPGTQAIADGGFYRADEGTVDGEISKWKPSIFMPRHASRLTLTVTDVRVERLQDITWQDAEAEGIWHSSQDYREQVCIWRDAPSALQRLRVEEYGKLWDRINGLGAWAANPWVVAYTFTVHRGNIDEVSP